MAKSVRRKLRQIDRAGTLSAEERTRLILEDRTERLAERTGDRAREAAEEAFQVLVCRAGRESFGIPIGAVAEVLPARECLPVPDGPAALVGLFGRGGHLVSVIDLGAALGLGAPAEDETQHLVLLRRAPLPVALRVGRAQEVATVAPIEAAETGGLRTDSVTGHAEILSGVVEREKILSLLDIERLLRPFLPSLPASGA